MQKKPAKPKTQTKKAQSVNKKPQPEENPEKPSVEQRLNAVFESITEELLATLEKKYKK